MTPTRKSIIWNIYVPAVVLVLLHLPLAFARYMDTRMFPYLKLYPLSTHWGQYLMLIALTIPLIMAGIAVRLCREPEQVTKQRKRSAVILMILAYVLTLNPINLFMHMLQPFYSETEDPGHYLEMGDTFNDHFTYYTTPLFPAQIPESAECVEYYNVIEYVMDGELKLYAQWQLPAEDFAREKQRIAEAFPDGALYQEQRGDWVCLHFTDEAVTAPDQIWKYRIFAYNDNTQSVRYIASTTVGSDTEPWYCDLEWEKPPA